MWKYVLKRLVLAIPTLLGALTILFILMRLIPGDPAQMILGQMATAEALESLRHQLGLDQPLHIQYLIFLRDFLQGNLGNSLATQTPTLSRIWEVFPYTVSLCLMTMVILVLISLSAGIICAVFRDSWIDYTVSLIVFLSMSMTQFWFGLLLLLLFSFYLGWFPMFGSGNQGDLIDLLLHLILPSFALAISSLGLCTRLTRSSMLEVLNQDYIRTARAKGLTEKKVVLKHALRNAIIPVSTVIGLDLGQLLGGAVIVEVVFARPGLGTLIWDAILQRDYSQVQASVAVFALLFILVNVLTDVSYAFLNPRVKM